MIEKALIIIEKRPEHYTICLRCDQGVDKIVEVKKIKPLTISCPRHSAGHTDINQSINQSVGKLSLSTNYMRDSGSHTNNLQCFHPIWQN